MSSFAFIAGETVAALAGHLVHHSRRRENQRLAVGDSGVIVDDQLIATRAPVLARYVLARRVANGEGHSLEKRSDFVPITV